MVNVDEAVIARLKRDGQQFEILVDCDRALEMRAGKSVSIDSVTATTMIFKDVKKGEKVAESELVRTFHTDDVRKIAELIVKQGEVQLTQHHRDAMREEKRKQLVYLIHRNAVDSRTGVPHPPQRIEAAMVEAHVHIDEHKSAEEQLDEVTKKLRVILPLKFETREIAVKIPVQYTAACFPVLKRYNLRKEEWQDDGSLVAVVEIPAGIQNDLFNDLNKLAHGEIESKVIRAT